MIISVTLNPSVDHALFLDELKIGDTNRVQRVERDAGGKGINLSRVVAELGSRTQATGFIGGGTGAYVRAVLDQQRVEHCFVDVPGETRTNFSVEDNSGRPPTTFNERGPHISAEDFEGLLNKVREVAPGASWLALGGSLPPGVPGDVMATLTGVGHEAGCKVMVDADGEALKLCVSARPNFIKPNMKEAGRLLGRLIETEEEAREAAVEILDLLCEDGGLQDRFVVLSQGAQGALLATPDGLYKGHSPQVVPKSTIGSGDSLIAGILWALEEGLGYVEAFRWGMACGAATATTNGSEIARLPVIRELLPQASVERVS